MTKNNRVKVIVLNWNNYQETIACIESLQNQTYPLFDIFIIDNGSKDNSVTELNSRFPDIELFVNTHNTGYSGGNNTGLKAAFASNYDYVWVLNSDAHAEKNCLELLVKRADKQDDVGLVSPVIYDMDSHRVQHAISRYNQVNGTIEESTDIRNVGEWAQSSNKIILWGTALLISKELFALAGGFDEEFFAYMEDFDISMKSSLVGLSNIVEIDAAIFHKKHPETRPPHYYYYTTRNGLAFWWRYSTSFIHFIKVFIWTLENIASTLKNLEDSPDCQESIKLGLWHFICNVYGEFDRNKRPPDLFSAAIIKFLSFLKFCRIIKF